MQYSGGRVGVLRWRYSTQQRDSGGRAGVVVSQGWWYTMACGREERIRWIVFHLLNPFRVYPSPSVQFSLRQICSVPSTFPFPV
ncbi:hypothetical protein HanHA89_Chr01g0020181 [Helianthus annuus]|nr:hypothetical protein HanHA89_Chr01g0020181 [Helianthus annuus]